MKYRTVHITPEGSLSRHKVREVVRGIHVMPEENDVWTVRTLGVKPMKRAFPEKSKALDFARSIGRKRDSKIVLHESSPKRARLLETG